MIEDNNYYYISKLDSSTYLVIDKTNKLSNHYYKTFSSASKKCLSIIKGAK